MKQFVSFLFLMSIWLPGAFAQTSTPPSSGDGSSGNPYEIATLDNLYWLSQNSSEWDMHFIQTADIDASATSSWDGGKGFSPIGNSDTKFTGTYDGNGKIIKNMVIDRPNSQYLGLFGYTNGATLTRIGIVDANFEGYTIVAALAANITNTQVSACFSSGSIYAQQYRASGLISYAYDSAIKNSYSHCQVVGGLGDATGFIADINESTTIDKCYHGKSTLTSMSGGEGLVKYNSSSNVTNSFWDEETSGTSNSNDGTGKTTAEMKDVATFTSTATSGLSDPWDFTNDPNDDSGTNDYWTHDPDYNSGYPYLSWQLFAPQASATSTDASSFTANWEPIINANGYYLDVATDDQFTNILASYDNMQVTGATTQAISGLAPGTTYYYRVRAYNAYGSGPNSNSISLTTDTKELTISGSFSASNKTYDGTTDATISSNNLSLDGIFSGHDVSLTNLEVDFDAADVGTGITVSISNAGLTGADAAKYTLTLTGAPTTTADITPAPTTWDGSTWSNGTPNANYNASLSGDFTTTAALEVHDLTIAAGNQLTADHAVMVNGNLLIESDASGTASLLDNGNLTVNGSSTAQMHLEATSTTPYWHYVTIPVDVSGSAVQSDVFGAPYNHNSQDYYAHYYDENAGSYTAIQDATTDLSGQLRGYAVPKGSAATLDFSGTLNSGSYTATLTRDGEGFNLVGNPYPSGLDLGNFDGTMSGITASNTKLVTTVWIRSDGDFEEYNWQSGTAVSGSFTGVVPPMQAFWLRVAEGENNVTFGVDNPARVHDNSVVYKSETNPQLRLVVSRKGFSDAALVDIRNNATTGPDNYDSQKMLATDARYPQIYMPQAGKKLAINGMPPLQENRIIPLGFKTEQAGKFTIKAADIRDFAQGTELWLEDTQTGTMVNLRQKENYRFSTQGAADNPQRFNIHLKVGTTTGLETAENGDLNMYSHQETLYLRNASSQKANMQLFDLTGRKIMQQNQLGQGIHKIRPGVKAGIYLVKFSAGEHVQTRKIRLE